MGGERVLQQQQQQQQTLQQKGNINSKHILKFIIS